MSTVVSHPLLWAARLLVAALLLMAGWSVVPRVRAEWLLRGGPGPAEVDAAAALDPSRPETYFLRGIARRDADLGQNLAAAQADLERSVELNPYAWSYPLELARLLELQGETAASRAALELAISRNPRAGVYRWRLANFDLRHAGLAEALPAIGAVVATDPELAAPALSLLIKAGATAQEIDSSWPLDPAARILLFVTLGRQVAPQLRRDGTIGWPPKLPAEDLDDLFDRTWRAALQNPAEIKSHQATAYFSYLLWRERAGDARDQWLAWTAALGLKDQEFEKGRDLVWGGGFDASADGSGLDWVLPRTKTYKARIVSSQGEEGGAALRIEFEGEENLNFVGPRQETVVPASASCRLAARARSEKLTSDQGVFLEVVDRRTGRRLGKTDAIRGTVDWTDLKATFGTPRGSEWLQIRVRRVSSKRIDNRLRGTLWLDDVSLTCGGISPPTGGGVS